MLKQNTSNVNPFSSYVNSPLHIDKKKPEPQHIVSKSETATSSPLQIAFAKQIKLKKSEYGIFSVIAYFNIFGFKDGCFIKQENYATQLKKFGYKALRRQQVGLLCGKLVSMGLVSRIRRHRRAPYEYSLTPLGEAFYELKNPTYKPHEKPRQDWPDEKKPYIENDKNRTSQLRSSFNKSSYNHFGKQNMNTKQFPVIGPQVKTQAQLDRDKINESKAAEMAKEALEREGLQDPYKNAPRGTQIDYETARNYNSKLSSYTCYFQNTLNAN